MRDFWLVITDLWYFCVGYRPSVVTVQSSSPVDTSLVKKVAVPTAAPERCIVPYDLSLSAGTIAYVVVGCALCHVRAVHSFDGVVARLPYGTAVLVGRRTGRFVEVAVGSVKGWVLIDDITTDEQVVFPRCIPGEMYDDYHPVTKAIRKLLDDAFFAELLLLPLTAEEYATYHLRIQKLVLAWPAVRPRVAGAWHTLLRGVCGIHSTIEPKTGAVMEWTAEEGVGHLAVVEAVQPDETIQIIGIGLEAEGKCTRLTMAPDVWREWRPVFISVS